MRPLAAVILLWQGTQLLRLRTLWSPHPFHTHLSTLEDTLPCSSRGAPGHENWMNPFPVIKKKKFCKLALIHKRLQTSRKTILLITQSTFEWSPLHKNLMHHWEFLWKFTKKKLQTNLSQKTKQKKLKLFSLESMWTRRETHMVLSRWCHCDHDVTLSDALPGCSFLGHGDEDGQVAGPGPQHWGVGHGHVNVVAVLREVRLPNGLNRRTQGTEKNTQMNFLWVQVVVGF